MARPKSTLSAAGARTVLAWVDELLAAKKYPGDENLERRLVLACLVGRLEYYAPPSDRTKRNL